MYRKAKVGMAEETKGASCAPAVEVAVEERLGGGPQRVEEEKKEESLDDIIKRLQLIVRRKDLKDQI
jgi:hypothetical protein